MRTRQGLEGGSDGVSAAGVDAATTRERLASMAATIDDRGIGSDPTSVRLVVHTARDLGINPVLVSVLADDAEPSVARERAFGRVSVMMEARLDAIHARAMLPSTC